MSHDKSHTMDWSGLALKVDAVIDANGVETALANITAAGALTALTDNSGGTADNTIAAVPAATAAVTDTTAASLTSTNASITAIKNDIADLTAKVNAIIAALKG